MTESLDNLKKEEETLKSKNEKTICLEKKVEKLEMMDAASNEPKETESVSSDEGKGGCMLKMHFDGIASFVQRTLKLKKMTYAKEKGLRNWRDELRKTQDCEKAKKHMSLPRLFETLSEFYSREVLWKEIARFMDANEIEIKLISKFHNEIIDNAKR